MPDLAFFHVVEVGACTLVVCRIEPEHMGKHLFRVSHPAKAPEAKTVACKAAQKGTVMNVSPGKKGGR